MALSAAITEVVENALKISIIGARPVSGGDINQVYRLQSNGPSYLLKVNKHYAYPALFKQEALGLQAIANTHTIAVPDIILQDEAGDESFLLMEWIENRRPTATASVELGRALAAMHRHTASYFGFDADNYMGSLTQSNHKHQSWNDFFIAERLQPMVKMATDTGLLNGADIKKLDLLYQNLSSLFQEEPPALIHGDLWSGNYLIGIDEKPYLIDPAVSYSHREADIAMTTLFGGFGREFYTAYNEAFPLAPGWQQRLDLWNLYPLLVHLNLFGTSYLGQVKDSIGQFM